MRDLEDIKSSPRVNITQKAGDGMAGEIALPTWRGSLIASTGGGWEHISVTPYKKSVTPSWEDMCIIKDIFFNEDEAVIQVHPPKEEYINNMPNCLHLWRCTYKDMVLPPSIFVGVKKGQTSMEVRADIKKAYEMAGEVYDG